MTADRFATWDAPYVLGALIPAERREYEAHLDECQDCRAAVAEIAGLPGLLARVPEPAVFGSSPSESDPDFSPATLPIPPHLLEPPAYLLEPLVSPRPRPVDPPSPEAADGPGAVVRPLRRRGWAVSAAVAVVSAAAAVAITIPLVHSSSSAGPQREVVAERSMEQLRATPITASYKLVADGSDRTRVEMECRYSQSSGSLSYSGKYAMWVTLTNGMQGKLAGWAAGANTGVLHPEGVANVASDQIRSVEIRTDDTSSTVLLSGTV